MHQSYQGEAVPIWYCKHCDTFKFYEDFTIDLRNKRPKGICKKCHCLEQAAYKKRTRKAACAKRFRDNHPEKARAWRILKKSLQVYGMRKPDTCEDCHSRFDDPGLLHAHHEDYSRPLYVFWLCVKCHSKRHKIMRSAAA